MSARGFTLVEVLIALAIASGALALLIGTAPAAARFDARISAMSARDTDIVNGLDALQAVIGRAADGPVEGDGAGLRFMIAELGYPAAPGLYEVELDIADAVGRDRKGVDVVFHRRSLLGGGEVTAPVLHSLKGASFAYAGRDGTWSTSWNSDTPPTLVRVSLESEGRPWPSAIYAWPQARSGVVQ